MFQPKETCFHRGRLKAPKSIVKSEGWRILFHCFDTLGHSRGRSLSPKVNYLFLVWHHARRFRYENYISLQSKQPRVAWILFACLVITKMNPKKKDENLITRHIFSGELSSTCHSVGFLCHRDVTGADRHLVVLSFTLSRAHRINPCSKRTRTYHLLHFLPESLVQQSVSKGIDGRVKYHYHVRDRSC